MFDKKIKITVETPKAENIAHKSFECKMCRHMLNCTDMKKCLLIDYLAERVPEMKKTIENNNAEITVKTLNDEFTNTVAKVCRAIRLRRHRYM